ncbi:hypothetical protein OG799_17425 [Micromonospora sp. NBC_00898]|uniref:hypothetical protein n=1 Tax=Micromonospora sp. NBC_00898 TaxID=2975981 RepID=UPI003866F376|nr:hypothetical protein OG799_17425 [Micromonospora sp. NBC_00898]
MESGLRREVRFYTPRWGEPATKGVQVFLIVQVEGLRDPVVEFRRDALWTHLEHLAVVPRHLDRLGTVAEHLARHPLDHRAVDAGQFGLRDPGVAGQVASRVALGFDMETPAGNRL